MSPEFAWQKKRSRPRLWLDRVTDRLVTRHICVSRDVADFSAQVGRLPSAKMTVIPNGVDVERFANAAPVDLARFGVPAGSRVLLFVGRLDPQKGPFELLHAAAQLAVDHADVHVLIVGDGPLASELRAWTTAKSRRGIHFAGRQANIAGLMRAADVFVLPSRWEGLPNVVLEAMAAGTPVVATAVEGIRDLLGDGKWGRVVGVGPGVGDGELGTAKGRRSGARWGKWLGGRFAGDTPTASSRWPRQPSARYCQRTLYVAHCGRGIRATLWRIGRSFVQVTHKQRSAFRIRPCAKKVEKS